MSASRLLVVLLVQMATVAAATNLSATFISTVIPTQIIDAAADTDPCDWGDKYACGVLLNCSNVDRADCARAVADGGCGDSCGENTVCKDGECVPDCVEEISSCCSPQAGPGCVLQFVNDCVKQFDSYCTDSKWDEQCVQEARMECDLYCGPPLTFQRVTDDVVEPQDEFVAKLFNLLSLPDGQQPLSDYIFIEAEEDTITRGGGDGGCLTSGNKGCSYGYQCYRASGGRYFCSWPLCPNTDGTQVIGGNSYCLCPSSLYSNVCAAGGYCNAGECIGPPAITDTCSRTQACAQDGMYCNYYTGTCYWPGNPCTSQPGYPVNPAYPCSQTCYDDGNCPVRQKCDSERHHCYQPTAGGGGNIDNGICQATGVATNTCSSIATYGYGDFIGTIYSYCLCNRNGYAGTISCASLWNQPSQRRGGGGSVQSDNQKACKEVLTKVSTYCCPNHDPDQYFIFNEMCSTLPECSQ